jgi:hypothetical protein
VKRSVYVDSGSTDGSVAAARARGVEVVELDLSIPFTAARARNAGWRRLLDLEPGIASILFVDGDCEIMEGFVSAAGASLAADDGLVAVCGYRRERWPDRTPYNTLCDIEWRMGPVGDISRFGGDVVIRASALIGVGGYDEKVIAAEDDELSVRLRKNGGRMLRLDMVSTIHDAAMTRAEQWWQRAKRAGHAYAQVNDIHGAPPERYFAHEVRSVFLWGLAIPTTAVGLAVPSLGLSLGLLGVYPLQAARTFRGALRRGLTLRESALWGASCTAAKIPETLGFLKYHLDKFRRRRPTIIEYKGAEPHPGA